MKVLLSAYACEPGKGSEPGVGWNWANGLASRADLTVLTREANRAAIEKQADSLAPDHPLKGAKFLYYDLPRPFLWAKKRGYLPTMPYYILWQIAAARRFAKQADKMDIVHHLTFCTLLCPGFWKLKRARFFAGPIGAPLVNSNYLPLFGANAWKERFRNAIMRNFHHLPWLSNRLPCAAGIVPANHETRDLLESRGIKTLPVILDTGAPAGMIKLKSDGDPRPLRLLYAGQLERRKGLEIALRALGRVLETADLDWRFDLYGKGPDEARLRDLATELHLGERVTFHGSVPREKLMQQFSHSDVFLFTSVRDTSGGVNLEAMAHGLPVICIAHQGIGDITRDDCAERVRPDTIEHTIHSVAEAILRLGFDPESRKTKGLAAQRRAVHDFSWEAKFETMTGHFRNSLSTNPEIPDAKNFKMKQ